jgi:3-hydroxybutyryl-CoA dehydratase
MTGKSINELEPGEKAEFSKTISETDIYLYAGITGDFNPAHINQAYAEKTFFKSRIAHGLLPAGFISTVIGTILPGQGTVYIKQELNFIAPVYIGDTITAYVEILEKDVAKNRVLLKTLCKNQKKELLIDGQAVVSPPKKTEVEPE